MNKWLKYSLFAFGTFAILAIAGVFLLVSRLMPGYEVADGTVYFRSFNNMNWKVERREVKKADSVSIRKIGGSGGLYGKDDSFVFFEEIWIKDADAESFHVLDWRRNFSCDKNWVYWQSIRLSDDPDHFEILQGGYSRDRNYVYHASSAIEGADPDSFVVTSETMGRGRDANREYNLGRPVE
ncbi:MAG: DKNYY domain-containing protein [Planctomycetota bacterium]